MPRDGRMVDETSILAAGIYNLGFIAVGGSPTGFLEYWKQRLRFECIVAPERMRFVDQRWLDFAPGMFEVAVLRDPAYNVAYWNLDHRRLRWSGSRYEVDGEPLRFFHFSGYKPDAPHLLSHHQGDRPRILLSQAPDLLRLCDEYGAELWANGFGVDEKDPYGIDRLANGLPIDFVVRTYYRDWVTSALVGEAPAPPDPFDVDGSERFLGPAQRDRPGRCRPVAPVSVPRHPVCPRRRAAGPDTRSAGSRLRPVRGVDARRERGGQARPAPGAACIRSARSFVVIDVAARPATHRRAQGPPTAPWRAGGRVPPGRDGRRAARTVGGICRRSGRDPGVPPR